MRARRKMKKSKGGRNWDKEEDEREKASRMIQERSMLMAEKGRGK